MRCAEIGVQGRPRAGPGQAVSLAVIVPNYNHARFLPIALDAILGQSLQPREILVIDDASTDESREVIAEYAARFSHIRPVLLNQNRGVVRNMSDALAEAQDDLLFFAAADDVILPGLFERSVSLMQMFPQAGLCSAPSRLMAPSGKDLGSFPTPRPRRTAGYLAPIEAAAHLVRNDTWMIGNTTILRRTALVEAGGFRENLASFTDGYVSRAIALRHGVCFIPEEMAYWRRDDMGYAGQTTRDFAKTIAIADVACRLMKEEYPGLFPERYPSLWRGRWLFGALTAGTDVDGPITSRLRQAIAVINAVDRVVLPMLDFMNSSYITKLYGFFRLRPHDTISILVRTFQMFRLRLQGAPNSKPR